MTSESTCQGCGNWHRLPPDPANLTAPRLGECRLAPQHLDLPVPAGSGRVALTVQPFYLQLPADFPACAGHRPRPDGQPEQMSGILRPRGGS